MIKGKLHFWSETGTEGGHWAFQDNEHIHGDGWSYEGLHVLKDGDLLKIFSKYDPAFAIWEGKIDLSPQDARYELVHGMRLHADQKGFPREVWAEFFFGEYEAELTFKEKKE